MTTHRPHPLSGKWYGAEYADPPDAALWDDCDRCEQHADDPLTGLDTDKIAVLYRRMLDVERFDRELYRTYAEAHAGGALYRVAVWVERTHPWLDPWTWPWSVRETTVTTSGRETPGG